MIIFGKKAQALLASIEDQGTRIDALEREVVRLITEAKEAKQEAQGPVISRASEEGEPWIRRSPVTH